MKVLMTADTLGGVFTYTVELVAALRERGAQFAVATFGRPMTPTQREYLRAAGPAAVYESGLALEWMPAPWKDVDASRRWPQIALIRLERGRVDRAALAVIPSRNHDVVTEIDRAVLDLEPREVALDPGA